MNVSGSKGWNRQLFLPDVTCDPKVDGFSKGLQL